MTAVKSSVCHHAPCSYASLGVCEKASNVKNNGKPGCRQSHRSRLQQQPEHRKEGVAIRSVSAVITVAAFRKGCHMADCTSVHEPKCVRHTRWSAACSHSAETKRGMLPSRITTCPDHFHLLLGATSYHCVVLSYSDMC